MLKSNLEPPFSGSRILIRSKESQLHKTHLPGNESPLAAAIRTAATAIITTLILSEKFVSICSDSLHLVIGNLKREDKRKIFGIPVVVHLLLPSVLLGSKLLNYMHSDDDSVTTYVSCGDG